VIAVVRTDALTTPDALTTIRLVVTPAG